MTFTAASVARATGASPATIQRYLAQNITPLQRCDVVSRGSGDPRQFSMRRVLQIGITQELSRSGIKPSRAGPAAFAFTDKDSPGRDIGQLYRNGTTYLIGSIDGDEVVCVPPDLTLSDFITGKNVAFVANLNRIVETITTELETN